MSKPTPALTKTCTSCGQQKPLSAFLQFAGTLGATYGSICASCRKTESQVKPKDIEESTRSSTGAIIDSKLKVKDAQDKRTRWQQIEDEFFENREEKAKTRQQQIQKISHTAKEEKKHRDAFPRTFIDNKNKATSSSPVFGGTEHSIEAGKFDPLDTRVEGLIKKTLSTPYQAFKLWLGRRPGDAPIVTAAEKTVEQLNKALKTAKTAPVSKTKTNSTNKNESDLLNDHLNKLRSGPK